MAITYRLEDHRVTFHWDRNTDMWTAISDDIKDLNLEASSFSSVLKLLRNEYPELTNSIRIFFPDIVKT